MAKSRTPGNNAKSFRRARAIKLIEGKLNLKDSELAQRRSEHQAPLTIAQYRAELLAHAANLRALQQTKGGTL